MSIQVTWDNEEKTVVRLKLEDGWTWQMLYERNQEIVEMMTSTVQPVHLMIDYTSNPALPTNGVIMHARNILGAYPSNYELRVIITNSMLVQRMVGIFQITFKANLGKQVFAVKTVEGAYRLFRQREQALLAG